MYQDPVSVRSVKCIAADMVTFFQNQNFQVQSRSHALGDRGTTEAGANNQTICFDHCEAPMQVRKICMISIMQQSTKVVA
jgi:hypothetical protein